MCQESWREPRCLEEKEKTAPVWLNAAWNPECSEWLAFLDAINPETNAPVAVQLFVDEREVVRIRGVPKRNRPAEAWLRASLIRAKGAIAQIVLPQPAIPLGETVFVKQDLVDL
jgi:hypothetical protein